MTDPRDDALARRYRASAREEPPAALDATIVAAARRAVARPRSSRWAVPVSIAAVLMLAVGVSIEMQRNEPGIETAPPARSATDHVAPKGEPIPPAPALPPAAKEPVGADANVAPQRSLEKAVDETQARRAKVQSAPVAPPAPVSPSAAAAPAARAAVSEARARLESPAPGDPLERLERIARLREQGRGPEADAELERFRRDFPGYRIPEETWERVRPR